MTDVAVLNMATFSAAGTTNMDWEPLRRFLWTKSFVSSPSEGFLVVLTDDLRKEVWSYIVDDKTFG